MFSRKHIGAVAVLVVVGLVAAGVLVVEDEQPVTPPVTPPVTQPAPRGLDDQGDLRLIRQTPTRIVLGWTPELTGYGYLFSGDGTVVARTTDPARSTATFRNIYTSYEVAAIDKGDTGTYSPLAGTLAMTVTAETANTITFGWTPQAEYGYLFSGDGDVISRTYDPDRSYAKFNKSYTDYEVAVLVKGVTGTYSEAPGGYPDATNTGWEHTGVTLTPSGGLTINTPDTVIDSLDITGCVTVNAANVTIKRSRITCSGNAIFNNSTNLLVEDVEIDMNDTPGATGITPDNYTARRVNVYGGENLLWANANNLIEDSYIHDPLPHDTPGCPIEGGGPNCHTDGIQGIQTNVTITHNTVYGGYIGGGDFGNSAITLGGVNACCPYSDVFIDDNVLAGGGYTLYCPQPGDAGSFSAEVTITNNRFSRVFVSTVGGFGPHVECEDEPNFTGNVYHETGLPV